MRMRTWSPSRSVTPENFDGDIVPNSSTKVRHSAVPARRTQSPPTAPSPPPSTPHGSVFIRLRSALTVTSGTVTVKIRSPPRPPRNSPGPPESGTSRYESMRNAGYRVSKTSTGVFLQLPLIVTTMELPSRPRLPPQPTPSKWKCAYGSPVRGSMPPNRNGEEVPPHDAAMRSGIACWSAPKIMSVSRGLVSVFPPATGAGNEQFTMVPGGAMIVNGR